VRVRVRGKRKKERELRREGKRSSPHFEEKSEISRNDSKRSTDPLLPPWRARSVLQRGFQRPTLAPPHS
jgi:hypothetical protein